MSGTFVLDKSIFVLFYISRISNHYSRKLHMRTSRSFIRNSTFLLLDAKGFDFLPDAYYPVHVYCNRIELERALLKHFLQLRINLKERTFTMCHLCAINTNVKHSFPKLNLLECIRLVFFITWHTETTLKNVSFPLGKEILIWKKRNYV